MKKRLMALLLAAALILGLTACGAQGASDESSTVDDVINDNSSIGIIGGTDGPTSMFLTEQLFDVTPEENATDTQNGPGVPYKKRLCNSDEFNAFFEAARNGEAINYTSVFKGITTTITGENGMYMLSQSGVTDGEPFAVSDIPIVLRVQNVGAACMTEDGQFNMNMYYQLMNAYSDEYNLIEWFEQYPEAFVAGWYVLLAQTYTGQTIIIDNFLDEATVSMMLNQQMFVE